jgi:flagella basal body P-ring formation protein FlgA
MLCRLQHPTPSPASRVLTGCARGLALSLSLGSAMAWAQADPGREVLFEAATQWVAQQQHIPAATIQFNPMDERVRIPLCQRPVRFDQPFANPHTLRARCAQPVWQHYLSFQTASATAPTPAGTAQSLLEPREVWVAEQLIRRGTPLSPDLFVRKTLALSPSDQSYLSHPNDLRHVELLRDMPAGSPIRSYDIKPTLLVKRGQLVLVSMGLGRGFVVTVRAESQQDGRMGEQIRLKNPESGRLLSAMVTGPNTAKGL